MSAKTIFYTRLSVLQKRIGITAIVHSDSGRSVERGLKDRTDFWCTSLKPLPFCLPVSISIRSLARGEISTDCEVDGVTGTAQFSRGFELHVRLFAVDSCTYYCIVVELYSSVDLALCSITEGLNL